MKSEEFQYCKFNSLSNIKVILKIDDYLHHSNGNRIQEKIDYLSPLDYGEKAALRVFYMCPISLGQFREWKFICRRGENATTNI